MTLINKQPVKIAKKLGTNEKIKCLAGNTDCMAVANHRSLVPFSQIVVEFLNDFSKKLLSSDELRAHSEIIAMAYWMRKAKIKTLSKDFFNKTNTGKLVARGTAFHIAPANVDTIFLYSMVLSLLAGNSNIVRISSADSIQIQLLLKELDQLLSLKEYAQILERTSFISYDKSSSITEQLSLICDIRVIWGGNLSVNTIRSIPTKPHAIDVCFPDKTSYAIFDSLEYLNSSSAEKNTAINGFINDSFVFGQMACSSPNMFIWLGQTTNNKTASVDFWKRAEMILQERNFNISDVDFINKLVAEQLYAVHTPVSIRHSKSNALRVVSIDSICNYTRELRVGNGFFTEATISTLLELDKVIATDVQTIVSYGINSEMWYDFLQTTRCTGISRIVPPGQALDFFHVWDGFDLMREFTREVTVSV